VAAISGSAFVILVLGFAVQRLLADVVAGFFILFEGQYAVGDLVEVDSTIPIGIVERASLRVTTLRGLNGDVIYVPNSAVKAAHRFSHGSRDMEIGVLVTDVAPVTRAVADAADLVGPGGVRFTSAPRITGTDDMGAGLAWVRVRADVPPGFEWMASGLLVDVIRARCGDALKGEPIVADVNHDVLTAYQQMLREAR
jgi:small conductance mechanosensitive channel